MRGLGKSSLSSESVGLYGVLRMLTVRRRKPLIALNIALSVFSACGKIVPVESILEETGTCAITGLGNDSALFWSFWSLSLKVAH